MLQFKKKIPKKVKLFIYQNKEVVQVDVFCHGPQDCFYIMELAEKYDMALLYKVLRKKFDMLI
jgi:hypothetical protein